MIQVLKQCRREIDDFPERVKGQLADAVARLDEGHTLAMPLSRPMPAIGSGAHELRFRDRSGVYRVVYLLLQAGQVWLLHAFQKKAEETPPRHIETARQRLKELLK